MRFDIVVPSCGRRSLVDLLTRLARLSGPRPGRIIVVDDRRDGAHLPASVGIEVVRGSGRGPAAGRNVGWRRTRSEWVVFLDDDVLPALDWLERLEHDLDALPRRVAGSQGRIVVPLRPSVRPTDWERNVRGLETACWATADMAYRRSVLVAVGGFDERFPRAYREDADLAARVLERGYMLERGTRTTFHPPRPLAWWGSVTLQRGNADDATMRRLHGRAWRARAGVPRGHLPRHVVTTLLGIAALGSFGTGRRRLAYGAGAAWLLMTVEFAWERIAPGPRFAAEVASMLASSVAIPPAAVGARVLGELHARQLPNSRPAAVLFDRDGTLIHDVPYNGEPSRVRALPGARRAVDRLRRAGLTFAVISNQSGVARGLLAVSDVDAVNRRVEELLGPLGPWLVCPHGPDDSCDCRKPRPGLVLRAARLLGIPPARCAVVGDVGADVDAALAAGARPVLVPTTRTRRDEVENAPVVAADLGEAADLILGGRV
jgi:histidinol-phosphate phosphatase family protein